MKLVWGTLLCSMRRTLIAVLWLSMVISAAELRWAPPSLAVTPPVVFGQSCAQDATRDAAGAAVLAPSIQCVAGQGSKTRGYLKRDCVLSPKALTPGATYYLGECKGKFTLQAEAIAQARVVAQLNNNGVYGDHGPTGKVSVISLSASMDLTLDVEGWFVPIS